MLTAANEFGTSIHIGCYAHTLNLAAQKSLKISAVDRLWGRVRSVVEFFHRSCTGAELLQKKIELLNLPNHKLIQDACTRLNSAADMAVRYLKLQPASYASFMNSDMCKLCKDIWHSQTMTFKWHTMYWNASLHFVKAQPPFAPRKQSQSSYPTVTTKMYDGTCRRWPCCCERDEEGYLVWSFEQVETLLLVFYSGLMKNYQSG